MVRMVADYQEPTFDVIEELLIDKTIKISMLAGQGPVLDRVKEELIKYWEREAKKGRSIEERARFMNHCLSNCSRLFQDELLQALLKIGDSCFLFLFQV